MSEEDQRVAKLRQAIRRRKVDALLVTNEHNVRYLTGFTGYESALLVTDDQTVFVTDSRYSEQAKKEIDVSRIVQRTSSMDKAIAAEVRRSRIKHMAFESMNLTVDRHKRLSKQMPKVRLYPKIGIVEKLREIKSPNEIKAIRRSVEIKEKALRKLLPYIRPGKMENQVADRFAMLVRQSGADECAFPTIVAAGPNPSQPHAHPGSRRIVKNDAILIDCGVRVRFYNSDLTRLFFIGRIPQQLRKIYNIVHEAQLRAIRKITSGIRASEVDRVARNYIMRHGFGKFFGHGLGHGIGLEIHERPAISPQSKDKLRVGMVITVEPGIYIPGLGGVRIEDMVLVTDGGCEVLTTFPRDLADSRLSG